MTLLTLEFHSEKKICEKNSIPICKTNKKATGKRGGDSRRRRGDNRRRRGKIEMVQTAKNIKKVDWFQLFNYTVNTEVPFRKENL